MTIQTTDPSQTSSLQEHIDKSAALAADELDAVRAFAAQLERQQLEILPIIGAGASHDCGVRLAGAIGDDLYRDYMHDPAYADEPRNEVNRDLADVAEAILAAAGQTAVVKAIGLDDPTLWPDAEHIPEHFCLHRVLARLARENLFKEVIGFNYDCAKEAGLLTEGYLQSPNTTLGGEFSDHATVIADKPTLVSRARPGALTYYKAHGCARRYRELAPVDEQTAAETIIICKSQLTGWQDDQWMRERLRDRARDHLLLLIGFAAQDPRVHDQLNNVLKEIYKDLPAGEQPRLVVIDWRPHTPVLRNLIKDGLGGQPAAPGVITAIDASKSSTTAVGLILLTETLRLRLTEHLENHAYTLSAGIDPQIAALVLTAPTMMRWTYLLREAQNPYIQRINIESAARNGYVPLTVAPDAAAATLATRAKLRELIGATQPESTRQALIDYAFITHRGIAYMPVALTAPELHQACRPGGLIDRATDTLAAPTGVERALITHHEGALHAVNIDTGREMPPPR